MRPVPDQRKVFLFPAFIVGGQKAEASISDLSDFGLEIYPISDWGFIRFRIGDFGFGIYIRKVV